MVWHNFCTCISSEILELASIPSAVDIEPVSGVLVFVESVQSRDIIISSIDDVEEEPNDVFTVKLITVTGGARISSQDDGALLTGELASQVSSDHR